VSETTDISDNFVMLVTDWISMLSPTYICCHQIHVANITMSPTSISKANIQQPLKDHPGFGDEIYIKRRKMFNNLVANNKVFQTSIVIRRCSQSWRTSQS